MRRATPTPVRPSGSLAIWAHLGLPAAGPDRHQHGLAWASWLYGEAGLQGLTLYRSPST